MIESMNKETDTENVLRQLHGGEIYDKKVEHDFSVNLNPLGMPEKLKEVLRKAVDDASCYPDYECASLRKHLAGYFGVTPSQVICTAGASEALTAILGCMPERPALIPVPSFYGYERAAVAAGMDVTYYDMGKLKAGQVADFSLNEDIFDVIPEKGVVILGNPNNPTGAVTERKLLMDILSECEKKETYLVMDESFSDFVRGTGLRSASVGAEQTSTGRFAPPDARSEAESVTSPVGEVLKSLKAGTGSPDARSGAGDEISLAGEIRDHEYLLIIKSFTKTYAAPGVRLGCILVSDENLADRIRQRLPEWNISSFAMAAGMLWGTDEKYIADMRSMVADERKILCRAFENMGFEVIKGEANFILIRSGIEMYEPLLKKGFLIRDCRNMRGLKEGYYRVAVKKHEENVGLINALCIITGKDPSSLRSSG